MDKVHLEMLEGLVDKFGLGTVLSGLSYICSEKSLHIAENWQDTSTANQWMGASTRLDKVGSQIGF